MLTKWTRCKCINQACSASKAAALHDHLPIFRFLGSGLLSKALGPADARLTQQNSTSQNIATQKIHRRFTEDSPVARRFATGFEHWLGSSGSTYAMLYIGPAMRPGASLLGPCSKVVTSMHRCIVTCGEGERRQQVGQQLNNSTSQLQNVQYYIDVCICVYVHIYIYTYIHIYIYTYIHK